MLATILSSTFVAGSLTATDTRKSAGAACCPVIELRQYTLKPGQRDLLIDLFEREFVETQEAVGMRLVGQFRDVERPDRFVWIRGFEDMPARAEALQAFYGGPVWKAHRDAANATMIDSDNVLLLRPVSTDAAFAAPHTSRAPIGANEAASSRLVATINYFNTPIDDAFIRFFDTEIEPELSSAGARPIARFVTESSQNTFPRLPVRTGEYVFVWFARFASDAALREYEARLAASPRWTNQLAPELDRRLKSRPEHLILAPTARSLLR
jgi:quinol monooxygenase YgiN